MRIRLLGNLEVRWRGEAVNAVNTGRLHSLIAYLVLNGGTPQPRERVAFALWPGSGEAQARTNLRQLLHHLKRALPAECDVLATDNFSAHWKLDRCSVDTVEFIAASAAQDVESLTRAAELYEDELLPGIYDEWLTPHREEFRRRIVNVLERLAGLHETRKEYEAAIRVAGRLVAMDSLCEAHHQRLIRLHAANQDRASALRAYHQCMRVLRRELGVQPGQTTLDLFERILKEESGGSAIELLKPASQLRKARALVGRAKEWQQLAAAWKAAVEDGPRVTVISGEPGIGKTRLADELYQSCAAAGYSTARARCYAGQGQVAYAPVADWLRTDAVRAGWAGLAPRQLAEIGRLIPEVETSPAAGPFPERMHFYESLNAAFGKCRKPALLFLDDMQWCDPDSFEWLNSLLHSKAAEGLLLVGTVRSEETGREHAFTRFLAGLRQFGTVTEIPLDPLDPVETEELARQESANPLDTANLGEIVRATRGNPLFVVESVRAGLQSTRVSAVIGARLAQLSAASYELAGLASVVGRPFSFEVLEKATDWDERSVSQALDELWRRKIIESRGATEYDFTHDRLREVACEELGLVRRRYLHRRVARALGEAYAADIESWNGQIAWHFEQAGMADEAIEHYCRAARHARNRFADAEAAELLRRALALCRGFPESARRFQQELELLVTLGPVLVTTDGYSAAEVGETYERALELSRRLEESNRFVIVSGAWVYRVVRGDLEKALGLGIEFLGAAGRDASKGLILAGNFIMGTSLFHLGRLEESQRHLRSAIAAYEEGYADRVLELFAGPDIGVFCRCYLAHLAWQCGDPSQADGEIATALAAARNLRHPFSQGIALDYAAMLHVFRGERELALKRGREAMELCARHGFAYYLAVATVLTGWAAADAAQLKEGMEGMRRLGAEIRLPYYYALLAELFAEDGMVGEAMASISTGFAFAGKNKEDWALAELHRAHGNILARDGKREAAMASYGRGLEAARRSGSRGFEMNLVALMRGGTLETNGMERS